MATLRALAVVLLLNEAWGITRHMRHARGGSLAVSDGQQSQSPSLADKVEDLTSSIQEGEEDDGQVLDATANIQSQDADGTIKVGFVSWNVAEELGNVNGGALHFAMKQATQGHPDYVAFAFQENMNNAEDTVAWLREKGPLPTTGTNGYVLLSYVARGNAWLLLEAGHGKSGVAVFAKIGVVLEETVGTIESGGHGMKLWKNWEKGLSAVAITINDKKLCFGSSHMPPGTEMAENKRKDKFNKYAKKLEEAGCDAALYGGDFNWRNGNWAALEKGDMHPHFKDGNNVKEYYAALTIPPATHFVNAVGSQLGAFPITADERKERRDGWLEGNQANKNTALKLPPSFQPAQCPDDPAKNTYEELEKTKVGEKYMYKDHKLKKDGPVCFKTGGGGNCPGNHICSSALRPLAYTDAIYSYTKDGPTEPTIACDAYGVVMTTQKSDHFPMAGLYTITLKPPITPTL